MKKSLVLLFSSTLMVGWITGADAAKSRVSPFTDNLTIHLQGFPSYTLFSADYANNNNVNISGPSASYDNTAWPVVINSDNLYQNGNPSLTLYYQTASGSGGNCTFNFADGPWTQLHYQYGSPPNCSGVTVSSITQDNQNSYELTITDNLINR